MLLKVNGVHRAVTHDIEIQINEQIKYRIKQDGDKLRLSAREGMLILEPVASNVILIDQNPDL